MIRIRVPCSSANLGPGFDTLGLALSLYLTLEVTIVPSASSDAQFKCEITCEGLGADSIRRTPDQNLITQVALYVLRCHGRHEFPNLTKVHIINEIPLSRGLGSSAAAVVAGAMLANEIAQLGLSRDRISDFSLMVERHPDNITAAIRGGFIGACKSDLAPEDMARIEIPLAEVLPEPAGGVDTGKQPPIPPIDIGQFEQFPLSPKLKAIVVIPDFKVDTARAREALPDQYSRQDIVFNTQRVTLLTQSLGRSSVDPKKIHLSMQDRVHQQYRAHLVPGLMEAVTEVTPASYPGVLGVCLSGAGPTVLALATENFESIAQVIVKLIEKANPGKHCEWKVLEPALDGAIANKDE